MLASGQPSTQTGQEAPFPADGRWFATTSWTAVAAAGRSDSPQAKEALTRLCQTYWEPLHAYLRRVGYNEQDAKDLTQEFFFRLLSKNYLGAADRQKGKFRSFLLTALKHFLANEWERAHALKRGGNQQFVSLDETLEESERAVEPASDLSPARIYERRWAMTLFEQAQAALCQEYIAAGKSELFEHLKPFVDGATAAGEYDEVALRLHMTKRAVTVAVYRLRQRFAELLRIEVARTLINPTSAEIEEELRQLMEAFSH